MAAFQEAGVDVPYRMATDNEIGNEWGNKFDTTTAGQSIQLIFSNRWLRTGPLVYVPRGLEQVLYDQNPGARLENGGYNKIRGISPSNPNLGTYMQAAWDYLGRLGG